ncbi:hypothetical protein V6B33_13685 [Mangrovibacillus sp. Mu-81]
MAVDLLVVYLVQDRLLVPGTHKRTVPGTNQLFCAWHRDGQSN